MYLIVIIVEFNVKPTLFAVYPPFLNDVFGLDGWTWQFKSNATLRAAPAAVQQPPRAFRPKLRSLR